MKPPPSERELRSLVTLLDDEDARTLDLVRREILDIGDPVIPFLEELRSRCEPKVAAQVESVTRAVRFQRLREDFLGLALSPEPDLEKGALLLARFGYPGVDHAMYQRWLHHVAEQVADDLPPDPDPALAFQRLNAHLFKAMGFSGNDSRYYDPDNSYLNRVIETRRGIPVSLSVLYILVAKRLHLPVYGVGTPGHFLVALRQEPDVLYLDAYNKGRLMTLPDVRRMLSRNGYQFRPEFTAPASPRDIIIRMMRNLISIYQKASQPERAEMLSTLVEIMLTGRVAD